MDMNNPITLEEQKILRYEILEEVDKYCRNNKIKYSLAFGTLLGAVRHQGFIPWDDDLDIMMPLPDMLKFKQGFKSEKVKFCDIDTEPHYRCAFANLGYKATYRKTGLVSRFFGVGVDVYPIIGLSQDDSQRSAFFEKAFSLQRKRINYLKWDSRLTRILPIRSIPGFDHAIKKYRDYLYNHSIPYDNASLYYVIAGSLQIKEKMIYNHDLFEELVELPFESGKFMCIKDYDYFMRLRYGDYMQLPPVEERVPHHGQTYYWK